MYEGVRRTYAYGTVLMDKERCGIVACVVLSFAIVVANVLSFIALVSRHE